MTRKILCGLDEAIQDEASRYATSFPYHCLERRVAFLAGARFGKARITELEEELTATAKVLAESKEQLCEANRRLDQARASAVGWRWVPETLAGQGFHDPIDAKKYLERELKSLRAVVDVARKATRKHDPLMTVSEVALQDAIRAYDEESRYDKAAKFLSMTGQEKAQAIRDEADAMASRSDKKDGAGK